MLEYRRPPPAPGPHWWGPRSYDLYLRRGEDWTPALAVGEERPLGRAGVRLFTCATSFYVQLTLREPRPRPLQLERLRVAGARHPGVLDRARRRRGPRGRGAFGRASGAA